ncbi:restriction endonuclease subunit S [Vibrio lentus]|uniref:restriction endonuclease subunit S n=1 Tax=Vibrio lentus TaxID=136468 RepID=UPI000C8374AE|nr:restriction endonuclease subunit S [Vibrio lentus]
MILEDVAGWQYPALGDICDVRDGTHDSPKYVEDGFPLITSKNLTEDGLCFEKVSYISQEDHDAIEKRSAVSDGDILYGMIGTVGNPVIVKKDRDFSVKNVAIFKFLEESLIFNKYLFYVLSSDFVGRQISKESKGGTQKFVSLKVLRGLKIPLPPLETQKQIAAVLEKADQLRKDCQQMEQELNSLAQSVFIDMFGSKASGYPEWSLHRIEELAESKKGSMRTGPFGSDLKHSEFVDEGIAVIGIDNAVKNEFTWGERRFITPEKYEKLKRYRVYPRDLIITIMGTTGRIAVIPDDIPLSISTKHLAVITLDKEKVVPEFLAIAIKTHPDLLNQILDSNKGAIMDGLNLGLIKALSLRLPPLDLQLEYLAVLKVIHDRISESRLSHNQYHELFNALMQKAFKGELDL